MGVITFLTDLGTKDHYVASVKGFLLSQLPGVQLVDITHQVQMNNILEGSFVLKESFPHFPKGTIHLVSVAAPMDFEKSYAAFKVDDQYFIGTDNGLFSMAFAGREIQGAVNLSAVYGADAQQSTLQLRDIFARAALMLASGAQLSDLGTPLLRIYEQIAFAAGYSENVISGNVIHSDHFGNAITNISKNDFAAAVKERGFTIEMWRRMYNIRKISKAYNSVPPGDVVALFNSSGLLELAIREGSAQQLLGLKVGDVIKILIQDDSDSTHGI